MKFSTVMMNMIAERVSCQPSRLDLANRAVASGPKIRMVRII